MGPGSEVVLVVKEQEKGSDLTLQIVTQRPRKRKLEI